MNPDPAVVATVSASGATPTEHQVPGSLPFAAGQLVANRFRIIRCVAHGGMGIVYEVVDEKLGERRALKCALPGHSARLSPEARHALRVTHPNVCRTFEIHSTGTPAGAVDFITMEYLDGCTLADRLEREGPLSLPIARDVAVQLCAGVEAAHAQGLLHRDLKAGNVMLTTDARGRTRAVVTDFGLARDQQADDRVGAGASGTLHYLAPERLKGASATPASDVFSIGILLHELVTAHRPAVTADGERLLAPGLPRQWRHVIRRCLQREPQHRYASAAAVLRALSDRSARVKAALWAGATLAVATFAAWSMLFAPVPATQLALLPLEATGTDAQTQLLVDGVSADLSTRLTRLRSRPAHVVIIPIEESRRVGSADLDVLRQSLGASHVLRGSVTRQGDRLTVRSAVIDATTLVAVRELNADYAISDAGAIVGALSAVVTAALRFPRQTSAETIAPEAYAAYAEGRGLLAAAQPDYVRTIDAFERAIRLDASSVLPLAAMAEACYRAWESTADTDWLTRGGNALQRAEALNSDSIVVRLAAGRLHLVPGTFDRAVRDYQRAVDLDATSVEAWTGLARAYESLGDRDADAASAYARAVELQPGYYAPLVNFGDFYRTRGNHAEAEKYFRQVVTVAPQLLLGHSNLGGLYSDMGRYADAQRELAIALQIAPNSRAVLNNLATVHLYQNQDAEAVGWLERAREVGPETYPLLTNLADSYRRLHRTKESDVTYRRARDLADELVLRNPRDAAARAFVAYLSARLGDRVTAERELIQALRLGGDLGPVIRRAAITYDALGKRERALAVLHSAPLDVVRELSRHPDARALREDPRFVQLLTRNQP